LTAWNRQRRVEKENKFTLVTERRENINNLYINDNNNNNNNNNNNSMQLMARTCQLKYALIFRCQKTDVDNYPASLRLACAQHNKLPDVVIYKKNCFYVYLTIQITRESECPKIPNTALKFCPPQGTSQRLILFFRSRASRFKPNDYWSIVNKCVLF